MQRVGIIIGTGPTASAYFYKAVIRKYRQLYGMQPELVLYNLSFPTEVEQSFLSKIHYKTKSYDNALEKAIMFMKSNDVKLIAFPCFSLTQIAEEKCNKHNIPFLNPYNFIPHIQNKKIGVVTANNNDELIKYLRNKISNNITFPFGYIKDIQKVIKQIINDKIPEDYIGILENIETLFIKYDISDYIIACSELCIVDYKSKINAINLLNILIEKTIEEINK